MSARHPEGRPYSATTYRRYGCRCEHCTAAHAIHGARTGGWGRPTPAGDTDWMADAACRGADPLVFHPERMNRTAVAAAKAYCDDCPVRRPCLEAGIAEPLDQGIMAGTTPPERDELRRKRAVAERSFAALRGGAA